MRLFRFAAFLAIMILAVPILKAHADTDVLVPSGNGGNNAPNLGLMPGDSSQPSSSSTSNAAVLPPDSMPAPTPEMNAQQIEANMARAVQSHAMPNPTPQMKTTIVKTPDMASFFQGDLSSLPQSIDVSLSRNTLSANQKRTITLQLGISDPDDLAACHLSASGYLQTVKNSQPGMTMFELDTKGHTAARYDGKISAVLVMVRALCPIPASIPPDKGIILQIGDKLSASLGTARCSPPDSGDLHRISVTIPETGQPECHIS